MLTILNKVCKFEQDICYIVQMAPEVDVSICRKSTSNSYFGFRRAAIIIMMIERAKHFWSFEQQKKFPNSMAIH